MNINKDAFGWFADTSETPEHDPGLNVPCIICAKPLTTADLTTISFLVPGDNRSYFYRTHKTCYKATPEEDISEIEGSIIDQILIQP